MSRKLYETRRPLIWRLNVSRQFMLYMYMYTMNAIVIRDV